MNMRSFALDLVAGLALVGLVAGEVLAAPAPKTDPPKKAAFQPQPAIDELTAAQQLAAIEKQLQVKLKNSGLSKTIRLSPRQPFVRKKAVVDMQHVDQVSTRDDQVSFERYGLVRIGFRSAPGYSYFVECGLSNAQKASINVHSYDATVNPDDEDWWIFSDDTRKEITGGTYDVVERKVQFSFGPVGVESIGIDLRRGDSGDFVWHYCKITPVKLPG